MAELEARIRAAATQEPTDDALNVMRLSVVDWIACGLAGRSEPVAKVVAAMLDEEGGAPVATCFDGVKRPPRAAALFNGTASHALDFDDTHFAHIGHPSVAVLPAVIAMAERDGLSFGVALKAALAGCEGAVRMGLALGRPHYQVGFHQTATAGAYGATLGAVLVHATDPTVHDHALGLASTRASGLKSQFGTMGKPFNAGLAASNAVEAALLAGRGIVSNPDGWDGPLGVIETQHGEGLDIGPDGFLMPSVSHKFHACCHGLHAMLEALESLKPLDPSGVRQVVVHTHPRWMNVCNQPEPRTGLELKFSYRGAAALTLLGYSTAKLSSFSDALARDAKVIALRDRVKVVADDSLSEMQARVVVDGREAFHDLDEVLPLKVRREKIKAKASDLIGSGLTAQVWEVVHGAEDRPMSDLTVPTLVPPLDVF